VSSEEPLPSPLQLEAQGSRDPVIRAMARGQRKAMRIQAVDDQVFAALLARVGGDEATARVYWDLGRRVRAYMSVPGLRSGPDDILSMFDDDELDDLAEQMSDQ